MVGVASIDPLLWFEDHHCGTFSRISSSYRILCIWDFLLFCLSSGDPPRDSCLTLVITWGKPVFQACGVVHPVLRTRVGVTHLTAFPTVLLAFLHPFCRFFFSLSPFLNFFVFLCFLRFFHPNLEASAFLLQLFFAFFRFLGALFGCLFWSFSGPFCYFWLFLLLELCFFFFFPAFSLDYLSDDATWFHPPSLVSLSTWIPLSRRFQVTATLKPSESGKTSFPGRLFVPGNLVIKGLLLHLSHLLLLFFPFLKIFLLPLLLRFLRLPLFPLLFFSGGSVVDSVKSPSPGRRRSPYDYYDGGKKWGW